ncbi:TolA-binding protein [Sphingomonas naasensis]|uniref:Uncharacterized protein n=1 Tax=Sphingomonas naasensis TaxID=1344951 RepID=A0A4S1W8C8_9SPHN|nr:hypothetical protein [Sphingomonas naasensis]NIJ21230.1 TolA-binding protein [Sphingomonas naasensis]TGX38673.1 hypothetical protein E5A74_17705 [Sphingomonas naasensis]
MTFLKRFSPVVAYRDLRFFLATRKRYELWFMVLALAATASILFVFFKDSSMGTARPYERNIIYVEQWPITRTDAQIKAQQKIDQAKRNIQRAELEKQRQAKQDEFKKVDTWLTDHGL